MDERTKKKFFNSIIGMTYKRFWECMNVLHSRAYALGQKHLIEAMECTPGISKAKINQVIAKSIEIREQWDGLPTVTVDGTADKDLELLVSENKKE